MAFCGKCGAQVADNTAFCPKCGASQSAAATPASGAAPAGNPAAAGSGLSENAASALSYVLGWITGLIFFFVDKRPYVRFHAAQSIVVFGALHIISIVFGMMFGFSLMGGFGGFGHLGAGLMFYWLLGLVEFILWLLLMIKGGSGQRFKVPIAGDIAENLAGKQI